MERIRAEATGRGRPTASNGVESAVGERLRTLRRERSMSLQTLAESTGLSIGYLSQLERGISTPTLRALTGLADALRVSTADLIRGDIGARRKTAPIITRSDERAKLKLWRSGIHKAIIAGG